MEVTNLGRADGLPSVDWSAIVEKLEADQRQPRTQGTPAPPGWPP